VDNLLRRVGGTYGGGRFEDGVESIEYACALDPLSNFMLCSVAGAADA
jgi:hypothetical protein